MIDYSESQAFPAVSTGIYGYPIEDATKIALGEVRHFLESGGSDQACFSAAINPMLRINSHFSQLERVIFVVWSDSDKEVYQCVFLPGINDGAKYTLQEADSDILSAG